MIIAITPQIRSVEYRNYFPQLKSILQFLQEHIATVLMVSASSGVPQKCITRYKRYLEKAGRLWEITKAICKQTGFKTWYLTTDENKAPNHSPQLNLF